MVEALTLELRPTLRPTHIQATVSALGHVFQDPLNPDFDHAFDYYSQARNNHSPVRIALSLAHTLLSLSARWDKGGLSRAQRVTFAKASLPVNYGLFADVGQLASWVVAKLPLGLLERAAVSLSSYEITPLTREKCQEIDDSFASIRKNLETMVGVANAQEEFFHTRLDQLPPVADSHHLRRVALLLNNGKPSGGNGKAEDAWGIISTLDCLAYRKELAILTPPQMSIQRYTEEVMVRLGFGSLEEVRDLLVGSLGMEDHEWEQLNRFYTKQVDRDQAAKAVAKAAQKQEPDTNQPSPVTKPARVTIPERVNQGLCLVHSVSDDLILQRVVDLCKELLERSERGVFTEDALRWQLMGHLERELFELELFSADRMGGNPRMARLRRLSENRLVGIVDRVIGARERQVSYEENKRLEALAQQRRKEYARLVDLVPLSEEEITAGVETARQRQRVFARGAHL